MHPCTCMYSHVLVYTCISVYIIKYTPAHTYTYKSSRPQELEGANVPPYKIGSSAHSSPKGAIHTHIDIYIYLYMNMHTHTLYIHACTPHIYTHVHA